MKNNIIKAIIALSFIAIIITGYLVFIHYNPALKSPCEINNKISCKAVDESSYSKFFQAVGLEEITYIIGFDIPVALIGFLAYMALFILSILIYNKPDFEMQGAIRNYKIAIFALSFAGFIFSMYLSYIEAFVLGAWCLFCIAQTIIITVIFAIAIILLRSK